ncbi:MAG: ribonuclease III [Xanthomonadales bacterium]
MDDSVDGIDYRFRDPALLAEALTHRSAGSFNNERLEFLGDSILGTVIAARLFERHPEASEGDMSRMRARLVRGTTLAEVAAGMDLGRRIQMGEGERKSGGYRRSSILADAYEALLGAIFLDGGFDACRAVILARFDPLIDALPHIDELKDAKTRLQEWLQGRGRPLPEYLLLEETGADHRKSFRVACRLSDAELQTEQSGGSRRQAEQAAAARMLDLLHAAEH